MPVPITDVCADNTQGFRYIPVALPFTSNLETAAFHGKVRP